MDENPFTSQANTLTATTPVSRRIAYYGGSFDPVHLGHVTIARRLLDQFMLDEFVFIPAFHAPHKLRKRPTSAYDRFAMLSLVTQNDPKIMVSKMEIEAPERPYSVDTLETLNTKNPDDHIFFVMGADSWRDITTWREWEKVLSLADHIVVTRPDVEIDLTNMPEAIRTRIIDLRVDGAREPGVPSSIYITDSVNLNISATVIRQKIRENVPSWRPDVPAEVANYIEKYQIYS